MCQDNRGRKYPWNLLRQSCLYFWIFFKFTRYASVNLSHAFGTLVSYFLGPDHRSFAPNLLFYWELEHI